MSCTASQFVELSHRFATGRAIQNTTGLPTSSRSRPGGLDEWTYDVVGRDTLRTALGNVDAFHLRPRMIGSPRGNFLMDIWYAPSLQYLPVRVRIWQNRPRDARTHIDLVLKSAPKQALAPAQPAPSASAASR